MEPHPKVEIPEGWARFHGVSMVFDTFGDVSLFGDKAARGVCQILQEPLLDHYAFRRLTAPSYHITFSDLIHDGMLKGMSAKQLQTIIEPSGHVNLSQAEEVVRPYVHSSGVTRPEIPTAEFEFKSVTYFQGRGIGIALKPSTAAESRFALLTERRQTLLESLSPLGVAQTAWSPHVTLGYFAYPELGRQAAEGHLQSLAEALEAELRSVRIRPGRPRLYAFTDMQTFQAAQG